MTGFEVVVVDDGSTTGRTTGPADLLAATNDLRFVIETPWTRAGGSRGRTSLHQATTLRCGWCCCSGNCITNSSMVFRRDLVLDLGGYDPEATLAEDYEMWLLLTRMTTAGVIRMGTDPVHRVAESLPRSGLSVRPGEIVLMSTPSSADQESKLPRLGAVGEGPWRE
jgi:hypothetical protein